METPGGAMAALKSDSAPWAFSLVWCVTRPFEPCLRRLVSSSDTPSQKFAKRVILCIWGWAVPTFTVLIVLCLPCLAESLWLLLSHVAGFLLLLATIVYCVVSRTITAHAIEFYLVFISSLVVVTLDLHSLIHMEGRVWFLWVVTLDLCLLCNMPSRTAYCVIGTAIVWITLTELDTMFNFGLLSDPLAPAYTMPKACDCERPPCFNATLRDVGTQAVFPFIVFVFDFYLTRRFAEQAAEEQRVVQVSIDTAERIATLLSEFDLESAQRILDEQRSLASMPPQLCSAFGLILHNLREYKPYLPKGLFDDSGSTADAGPCSNTPPGEGEANPRAGVVFTDIKGSTALWEECADSMADAIQIHNRVIRDCIRAHGGYEVKTMGDSFMVAFTTALGAVRFGLDVQKGLHEAEWPEALAEHSDGLRVRVGANYGPVTMEWNQLTERMDYLGPTVNRASRLEGCGVPGRVAVLEDMYESEGVAKVLCGVVSSQTGVHELKGAGTHKILSLTFAMPRESIDKYDQRSTGRTTSVCSSSVVSMTSPVAHRLDELMQVTKCTVGQIQLQMSDFSEQGWRKCKERFAALSMWLRRTDGAVASVSGLSILATWGLLKRMSMHAMKAFRFAGLVQQHVPKLSDGAVTCGLSTGLVSGCHVGDWEARFLAYGGRCLSICWALCALAQRLRADVLYATEAEGVDPAVLRPLRPVGRVEVAMDGREITAYEVCGQKADRLYFDADNEGEREWGWSRSYAALFHAGDAASIRERADASCDTVLLHACNLIEQRAENCCVSFAAK